MAASNDTSSINPSSDENLEKSIVNDDEIESIINEIKNVLSLDDGELTDKIIDDLLDNGRQSLAKYKEDIIPKVYKEVMSDNDTILIPLIKKYIEREAEIGSMETYPWFISFLNAYKNGENRVIYDRVFTRSAIYGPIYMKNNPLLSFVLQLLFEGIDDQCLKETNVFDDLWFSVTNDGLKSITKYSDYIIKSVMNEQLKRDSILFQALREYYREGVLLSLKESNITDKKNLYDLALDDITEQGWLTDLKSIEESITPKSYKTLLEKLRTFHQKQKPNEKCDESESGSFKEESASSFTARAGFTAVQNACQIEALKLHNTYRARHGVPALVLDDDISRKAQAYADYLARSGLFQHSSDRNNLGENLFAKWSTGSLENTGYGKTATESWYSEVRHYNYSWGGFSMSTGHFTQVVWKSTKQLGVGVAFGDGGRKVIVVAQYRPAGNMRGDFQRNVLPSR
ncbi:unnamed protein product [Rotaria sp. Silwood1]|nr:unnamed protein product [Rotaria sp. Silwood1]CAF3851146.1 unnamed protein product [Rotaria sp. Silwood1]CAF4836836.1 unnamed protein product [Rotaria sp. Silwood1]CAF4916538.1 unnamed protein product [Rotaria sp. Silwood1]CAF5053261.1 unnamed protein product [Rotaria sp. Silwood1]